MPKVNASFPVYEFVRKTVNINPKKNDPDKKSGSDGSLTLPY